MLYIILILGMLPAIALIVYMYKLDAIEKEPRGLLLKLFLFGGLTTFPAMLLEMGGMKLVGLVTSMETNPLLYQALEFFLVVGISEEGVKYFVLRRTWFHKAFNYRFDAVVYAVCVSLGFAAFENVMYIFGFGLGVAPLRAITAIPLHCIAGVFMGHYYGEAKFAEYRHAWTAMHVFNVLAMVIPVALHGFYDFAASSDTPTLSMIFLVYVVVLDIIAFLSVRAYAKEDRPVVNETFGQEWNNF